MRGGGGGPSVLALSVLLACACLRVAEGFRRENKARANPRSRDGVSEGGAGDGDDDDLASSQLSGRTVDASGRFEAHEDFGEEEEEAEWSDAESAATASAGEFPGFEEDGGGPLDVESRSFPVGEDPEPTRNIKSGLLACCCKPENCTAAATGARGLPARQWLDKETGKWICCKERKGSCDRRWGYTDPQDVSRCLPEGGTGRAKICYAPRKKYEFHMSVNLEDVGCLELLDQDGTVNDDHLYVTRDCPFYGLTDEAKARRQLLLLFHEDKLASYGDVVQTCDPQAGQGEGEGKPNVVALDHSSWPFMSTLPLSTYLDTIKDKKKEFICETLRLLPLIWSRIGFLSPGVTYDNPANDKHFYPFSLGGSFQREIVEHPFTCHAYKDLSEFETLRSRRILRAMLPTWSVYVFAQDIYMRSVKVMTKALKGNAFVDELARECARRDDVGLAKAPLAELQNKKVLKRDAGDCSNRYPCGFLDRECMYESTGCKCTCYKAICRSFVYDFARAVKALGKVEQCRDFSPFR